MEVKEPSARSLTHRYSGGNRQSYDDGKSIGGWAKWERAFSIGKTSSGDHGFTVYHP